MQGTERTEPLFVVEDHLIFIQSEEKRCLVFFNVGAEPGGGMHIKNVHVRLPLYAHTLIFHSV